MRANQAGDLLTYLILLGSVPLGILPAALLSGLANVTLIPWLHLGEVRWQEMYVFMLLCWMLYVQLCQYGAVTVALRKMQIRAALERVRVRYPGVLKKTEEE